MRRLITADRHDSPKADGPMTPIYCGDLSANMSAVANLPLIAASTACRATIEHARPDCRSIFPSFRPNPPDLPPAH
jgi:hypothetical protein